MTPGTIREFERLGREAGELLAGGVLAAVRADRDVVSVDDCIVMFRTPGLPTVLRASVVDFAIRKNLARRAVEKIALLEVELTAAGADRGRVLSWRHGAVTGLRNALSRRDRDRVAL